MPTNHSSIAGWLLALAAGAAAAAPLTGAYKDVSLGIDAASARIAEPAWMPAARRGEVLIWAFATGDCSRESWGEGIDTEAFARMNVQAHEAAGRDYIVSTGGEAGGFSCHSDEGMQRFVQRYASPRLLGLDFDIERGQSAEQIAALVRHAHSAQRARPSLRITFTVATHAGSDGTRRSLNATGEVVVKALAEAGFERAIVNLMVMNYGAADPRWCVVAQNGQRCDMGRSALQAARNVHLKYGIPLQRIALTPMLGENDVQGNVFTPADARTMLRGARRLGLAGVHYWSLDRDQPCTDGQPRVSPRCHALPGVGAGAFAAVFDALPPPPAPK